MLLLLRFLRFFQNPKVVTFYVFFAVFRTFSRTMVTGKLSRMKDVPFRVFL